MLDTDFLVLGGGTAGLAAATRAAAAGRDVTLVERGSLGGLTALAGCQPKKVLVHASEQLRRVRHAELHGIALDGLQLDWSAAVDRAHEFTEPVPQAVEELVHQAGIRVLRGLGRFTGPDELTVADHTRVRFRAALIAVGSAPIRLPVPGGELLHNVDEALELREPPSCMAVIGGGAAALELGQMFARLGTEVTFLVRGGRILSDLEPELADRVLEQCSELDARFHFNAEVRAVRRDGRCFLLELDDGSFSANYALAAIGRRPRLAHLGLENAGIRFGPRGIHTDLYLRCRGNPRIYAAGEARGNLPLSSAAGYEGRLAAENFLEGNCHPVEHEAIPRAVFTLPAVASVGLTEEEVRAAGLRCEAVHADMTAWPMYAIEDAGPAYAKVLFEPGGGPLLGAHLFGPGAENTIHIFAMALRYGIDRRRLREMVYVYPSLDSALGQLL